MFNNQFRRQPAAKKRKSRVLEKFNAIANDKTTLSLIRREGGLYLIIKKDLSDYHMDFSASEAPILNQFLKTPEPYESLLADIDILKEELMPINLALQTAFGEKKEMSLLSVKLAIGSGEDDYVTITENDLFQSDVESTLEGLIEFVTSNENVIGFCDRIFDHEKGNIILLEANIKNPNNKTSTINLKILTSLQQRGLFMRKEMKYAGLQLYIIVKAESLSQDLLDFMADMGIDWETIFLRRLLGIEDWLEIECENNSLNLKAFLAKRYTNIGYFDLNSITRIAIMNQLNFKVVTRMAELLDLKKLNKAQESNVRPDSEPLSKAEIVAAARLSCAYYGIKQEIILEKNVEIEDVLAFEAELVKL